MSDTENSQDTVVVGLDDTTKAQCTPISLAFPPVSKNAMFATGLVTIAGVSDGTCSVSIYSVRSGVITPQPQVVIPKNLNSASVPVVLTPPTAGGPYVALYAVGASGIVNTTVIFATASATNANLADVDLTTGQSNNQGITITDVAFPDVDAPTDTGKVTFSQALDDSDTVYLTTFTDPEGFESYFVVPPSVPVSKGQDHVEVLAKVFFQTSSFKVYVVAQLGVSSKCSNAIKVPAE